MVLSLMVNRAMLTFIATHRQAFPRIDTHIAGADDELSCELYHSIAEQQRQGTSRGVQVIVE